MAHRGRITWDLGGKVAGKGEEPKQGSSGGRRSPLPRRCVTAEGTDKGAHSDDGAPSPSPTATPASGERRQRGGAVTGRRREPVAPTERGGTTRTPMTGAGGRWETAAPASCTPPPCSPPHPLLYLKVAGVVAGRPCFPGYPPVPSSTQPPSGTTKPSLPTCPATRPSPRRNPRRPPTARMGSPRVSRPSSAMRWQAESGAGGRGGRGAWGGGLQASQPAGEDGGMGKQRSPPPE